MSAPVGRRVVPPAALVVLRLDDQVDGLLGDLLHLLVAGHAVDLREGERGHAVAVHVAAAGADEVAVVAGAGEQVADALGDDLAVVALVGDVAVGHEREQREAGDRGVAPRAVRVLAAWPGSLSALSTAFLVSLSIFTLSSVRLASGFASPRGLAAGSGRRGRDGDEGGDDGEEDQTAHRKGASESPNGGSRARPTRPNR